MYSAIARIQAEHSWQSYMVMIAASPHAGEHGVAMAQSWLDTVYQKVQSSIRVSLKTLEIKMRDAFQEMMRE